jgi:hypothetical protein
MFHKRQPFHTFQANNAPLIKFLSFVGSGVAEEYRVTANGKAVTNGHVRFRTHGSQNQNPHSVNVSTGTNSLTRPKIIQGATVTQSKIYGRKICWQVVPGS